MSVCFFHSDPSYRRYLAERPGLWRETGAEGDPVALRALLAERRAAGLPEMPVYAARLARQQRWSRSAELQAAWGFPPAIVEDAR